MLRTVLSTSHGNNFFVSGVLVFSVSGVLFSNIKSSVEFKAKHWSEPCNLCSKIIFCY